jgi:hypothetical protein
VSSSSLAEEGCDREVNQGYNPSSIVEISLWHAHYGPLWRRAAGGRCLQTAMAMAVMFIMTLLNEGVGYPQILLSSVERVS